MTYIDPTAATASAAATAPTAASAATAASGNSGLNQLDNSQTFLQLLVAQLKNQDPDNPTDPTTFMTEIAQLTQVQSQTSLSAEEETVAADSMLGRTITGSSNGQSVSGVVSGVFLNSNGPPSLQLTGLDDTTTTVPLSTVTQVYATAPQATQTAQSPTASA